MQSGCTLRISENIGFCFFQFPGKVFPSKPMLDAQTNKWQKMSISRWQLLSMIFIGIKSKDCWLLAVLLLPFIIQLSFFVQCLQRIADNPMNKQS